MLEKLEGFQDTGRLNRGPEIAKQAAVFMVRGLYYQWKLPVVQFPINLTIIFFVVYNY